MRIRLVCTSLSVISWHAYVMGYTYGMCYDKQKCSMNLNTSLNTKMQDRDIIMLSDTRKTYVNRTKHTYIQTFRHAGIHSHIHTYVHKYIHMSTRIHAHIHTHKHTHIHTYPHTHKPISTLTCIESHVLTYPHTYTRVCR